MIWAEHNWILACLCFVFSWFNDKHTKPFRPGPERSVSGTDSVIVRKDSITGHLAKRLWWYGPLENSGPSDRFSSLFWQLLSQSQTHWVLGQVAKVWWRHCLYIVIYCCVIRQHTCYHVVFPVLLGINLDASHHFIGLLPGLQERRR